MVFSMFYGLQGCSCDVAVIQGAKQNGIRENAVRISKPPSVTASLYLTKLIKSCNVHDDVGH